ncbi:50S ribosomal protein L7/L12 [Candidatus Curtissbacteria bacterium]|nr:50S ribosomal protein L7/L12 [Candidatus Curtissbacteria bacterium]
MQDDQNDQAQTEKATAAPTEETPVADTDQSGSAEEPKAEEPKNLTTKEPKSQKAVSKKLEDLMGQIEKLSVLELSELVHALEDKFGVSASAAAALAPAAAAGPAEAADLGQTTFNVVLADSGANKISVIKVVRELVPTLGLKEAKDLVDAPPKNILEGANKENANEAKTKLEAAGAKVELK